MERLNSDHRLVACAIFVGAALAVLQLNASAWLPAVHADSVQYMEAGESLANGNGLQIPFASWADTDSVSTLSHFPPGMSVAIAGIMKTTGARKHIAALWVLCLAAGFSLSVTFLIGSLVGGWGTGFLMAIMVAVMPPFVIAHTAIWSEPLYVSLLLLTLLAMVRIPEHPIVAGLLAAAAVLVRYLGVSAVLGLGVWTFFKTNDWKKTLVSVSPGTVAFLSWSIRAREQGGAVRTIGEYAVDFSATLAQLPGAFQFWLTPGLGVLWTAGLLVAVVWAMSRAPRTISVPVAILVGAHLLVILASRLVVDARIPFDQRMFMPVFVLAMLSVAAYLAKTRISGVAIALGWCAIIGMEDQVGLQSLGENGSFYSSREWMASDLISWVDNRMAGLDVYSNEPGMTYFLSERSARTLPLKTQDFEAFTEKWKKNPGAIVLVAPLRPDEIGPQPYLDALEATVVHQSNLGVVLMPASSILTPTVGG